MLSQPLKGFVKLALLGQLLEPLLVDHAAVEFGVAGHVLGVRALLLGTNEELVEGCPFCFRELTVSVDVGHAEHVHLLGGRHAVHPKLGLKLVPADNGRIVCCEIYVYLIDW